MDASVPIFRQTLGPLGLDVPPTGETTFEEILEAYRGLLASGEGPVHIAGMTAMAECRAALLAVREAGCCAPWVSWVCDEDGESPTLVHMLAALFVAEGMGAAAFGVDCPENCAAEILGELARFARIPLFRTGAEGIVPFLYFAGLSGTPDAAENRRRLLKRLDLPEHMTANAMLEALNVLYGYEGLARMGVIEEEE